ncbi:hypothetical protein [Actinoplanes sp. NPDC020271]|uniref:hypothetical protein n=1 Tax=Actinoplanes sp. NPDC020271 TaxID=3363896 RepID=UPI0037931213
MTVQHLPRVVWDGARAFVRAARGPDFFDFVWAARELLGKDTYTELIATRERLTEADVRAGGDPSAIDMEAGRWRVRLDELLHARPDLTSAVVDLTARSCPADHAGLRRGPGGG